MNFSLVSKYRTELMGYAIVGVLIGHILVFGGISTSGATGVLSWFSYLIHTSGFLFLSGFGVYYSLKKDSRAGSFYQRRFYRFVLPFLFMAAPYFLVVAWANHSGVQSYLGYVSTAAFWYQGNYHGMWYIAVSLLLYIITPPYIAVIQKVTRYYGPEC